MAQDTGTLVWEIVHEAQALKMSICEQRELVQTIRHYSQCSVSFAEVQALCQEMTSVLSRTDKGGIIDAESLSRLKKAGGLLWGQLLTRPVKDRLRSTIIRDLVLTIDEELVSIPWELLYSGEYFVCLRFNVGRLVRTKKQPPEAAHRSAASSLKMQIIADPTGDLRASYREGLHIKNHFDRSRSRLKIDLKSTSVDTLYVKKNIRDYDIVHYAGHCEYTAETPLDTGWVLSDGKFTAQDILALGEGVSLPSLVFSNSCCSAKTAAQPIGQDYQEKAYSLAAAFLFAGVKLYIGAIWKIEDPTSFIFAREFYARLIKGEPVGQCVRLARLRLIRECGLTNIHWASYLLYGDPAFFPFGFRQKQKALPFVFKKKPGFYRQAALKASLLLSAFSVGIWLFLWLPNLNPSTRLLFAKSQRLSAAGMNQEAVLACSQILQRDPAFLSAYPLLAEACQRLGRREEALRYYFAYALQSQKKHAYSKLADAYIRLGWMYQQSGDYPRAFVFYGKAIDTSNKRGDKLHEAVGLRKLAVWYIDKENYDKALELLTKSSEINRERSRNREHRYNLACDYFDIGLVFSDKDDLKAAKEFYGKSQALFERMKLKNELSDYYFNLGEICLSENDYQKALDCYKKGLAIDEAQGNRPNIAGDYNMLGELYAQTGNVDEAEKFFRRSVLLCQEINASLELASAYLNLGSLYKQGGEKDKAIEYLSRAQAIYRKVDTPDFQRVSREIEDLR